MKNVDYSYDKKKPHEHRIFLEYQYTSISSTIENTPDKTQTISEAFTDPVYSNTPVGDMNIPDPIILPTITVMPFNKLIFGFSLIPSSTAGTTSSTIPSSLRLTPILSYRLRYLCFFRYILPSVDWIY